METVWTFYYFLNVRLNIICLFYIFILNNYWIFIFKRRIWFEKRFKTNNTFALFQEWSYVIFNTLFFIYIYIVIIRSLSQEIRNYTFRSEYLLHVQNNNLYYGLYTSITIDKPIKIIKVAFGFIKKILKGQPLRYNYV